MAEESQSHSRRRIQFTPARLFVATFWMAICFAALAYLNRGGWQQGMVVLPVVCALVACPLLAIGTLFARPEVSISDMATGTLHGTVILFKILLIFVAIFVLIVCGFIVFLAVLWLTSVSDDRIHGVKIGMTQAQVVQVMGEPGSKPPANHTQTTAYHWVWRRGILRVAVVEFSPAGIVTDAFND